MPIAISPERPRSGITRFTGGRLVEGDRLVEEDLWVCSLTGKILQSQKIFYDDGIVPDRIIDLEGRILAPGFIDVQFNGGFGFDFSTVPDDANGGAEFAMASYAKGMKQLNRQLVRTGVTSYLPTMPSQRSDVYHKVLSSLGPSGAARRSQDGSESLGAHIEGPFIAKSKCGIHAPEVLREAPGAFADLEACYGAQNLPSPSEVDAGAVKPVSLITLAPEVPGVARAIPELVRRGVRVAIGHSESTYEEAKVAVQQGATMITHLFNAMRPLHHRNPGIFGVLGQAEGTQRPYYGVIADGIHLHPTSVKIAWNAHPDGFILVTDAMKTMGLPDGAYDWTNGDKWIKEGPVLTRRGTGTLAGSCATLIECVNNFWTWSHASIPEVIRAVTLTPAKMLGMEAIKGTLEAGADADLLVLDPVEGADGSRKFGVEQVWKFGQLVFDQSEDEDAIRTC